MHEADISQWQYEQESYRAIITELNHREELERRNKELEKELEKEIKARKEAEQKSLFSSMLQGTGSNKLAQASTRSKKPNVNTITGVATIVQDNHKTIINNFNALRTDLRVSTHKLLDTCIMAFTAKKMLRKIMISTPNINLLYLIKSIKSKDKSKSEQNILSYIHLKNSIFISETY